MSARARRTAVAVCALLLLVVPAAPGRSHAERPRGGAVADAARARCAKPAPRRLLRCLVMRRRTARAAATERLVPGRPPSSAPDDGIPAPQGGGSAGGGGGTTPAPVRFVSVAAREWSLTLSRPLVGAGSVTVELRNVGEDPHNLIVSPDDGSHAVLASWPDADPGATARQAVALVPGDYRLWCSLDDHEARGMSVRLRVE